MDQQLQALRCQTNIISNSMEELLDCVAPTRSLMTFHTDVEVTGAMHFMDDGFYPPPVLTSTGIYSPFAQIDILSANQLTVDGVPIEEGGQGPTGDPGPEGPTGPTGPGCFFFMSDISIPAAPLGNTSLVFNADVQNGNVPSGVILTSDVTVGGYTLGQIVTALQRCGILE